MRIPKKYDVGSGVADLWSEIRRPQPYRWPILAVSCALTATLFYNFMTESVFVPPAPPEVTYITSFAPDRTDAEIAASNVENQRRQDARQAMLEAREERRREMYRALGQATGIDTDAMEAEIAADRAREQAAEAARAAEARSAAGIDAAADGGTRGGTAAQTAPAE